MQGMQFQEKNAGYAGMRLTCIIAQAYILHMNKLDIATRARIISCLIEGNSLQSTVRMTGAAKKTVSRLLVELGKACSEYQDKVFKNLTCKRIQCDEIWSFVGCKDKNATPAKKAKGQGDVWTWTAICADTKLVPCWYVGTRDGAAAYHFIHDLAARLAHKVQLTTDGHTAYLSAVEDAFGSNIDYAQLVKIYGTSSENSDVRYSPAQCMGAKKACISGKPVYQHVSTSFVERQNLTMRMGMRRFTRLTNAFSKKVENHEHAVALHFMYYNFCRIHKSLRVSPAMEAKVTDHLWTLEEVAALMDKNQVPQKRGPYKKRISK